MTLSALDDESRRPSEDQLQAVLGTAFASWVELLALVADYIEPVTSIWKFNGGWSLRVLHKKRVILYMTPQQDRFLVSMALGERAVAAAHAAKLAGTLLTVIDGAPRYAEGRGVRIPVRGSRQLKALARLAQIKHEH